MHSLVTMKQFKLSPQERTRKQRTALQYAHCTVNSPNHASVCGGGGFALPPSRCCLPTNLLREQECGTSETDDNPNNHAHSRYRQPTQKRASKLKNNCRKYKIRCKWKPNKVQYIFYSVQGWFSLSVLMPFSRWTWVSRCLLKQRISNQQSAMQMNRCRHLVPLYPYHATNYNYYNLITFNCVL